MKVLYIGHYKEGSGWSKAALNSIEALAATNMDVVCRNVKLTSNEHTIDPKILELEKKDLNNVDYCIQHVLPHHITGTNRFKKNVAHFVHEMDSIRDHHWYHNLELVDEVWVPNSSSKNSLIADGFDSNKLKVIPYTFDMAKYEDNRHRISFDKKNHTFKFYFICELDDRKNMDSIIRCFHSEFHASEPVSLVLKVKKTGIDPNALRSGIAKMCDELKSQMRLYSKIEDYNHEIIITEDFTDEQIKILHQSCDCYVGPTHGEGWGIPAFDAMAYGKTPICSDEGGPKDFIDSNNKQTGWLVGGSYEICNHRNAAFPDIFTARHHWFKPNEIEIKKAMRYYFENRGNKNKDGLQRAMQFSYQNVGQIMKDALQ
jgi:glycosyltransferase involved in cell wall biosynthesis